MFSWEEKKNVLNRSERFLPLRNREISKIRSDSTDDFDRRQKSTVTRSSNSHSTGGSSKPILWKFDLLKRTLNDQIGGSSIRDVFIPMTNNFESSVSAVGRDENSQTARISRLRFHRNLSAFFFQIEDRSVQNGVSSWRRWFSVTIDKFVFVKRENFQRIRNLKISSRKK